MTELPRVSLPRTVRDSSPFSQLGIIPRFHKSYSVLAGESLNSSWVITDEIKELMQANPFRPIRIVLGDQQSFTVAHTDYLMISPDRQTVVLYDEHNRFKIINTQQIRLVELADHSGASGS